MTTIGIETGIQQEQHEYLSRLIYIFLLQIFTDKMTRFRIETGPQPSAMETSLREESREEEEEEKEASIARILDVSTLAPSPWRRARFVEGKIYILYHCEEEFQTTRKVCPPQRSSLVETIR